MNDCTFYRLGRCQALKNTICTSECKFKKTDKEFAEAQDRAAEILAAKGLAPTIIHTSKGEVMSTKKVR